MSGYEKIADLMTKHAEMATFQRFDFLNTMNMLFLQAELVHLEDELRESMRDDLQSGQQPAPSIPIDATSRRESTMTDENVINESGRSRNENEHEMASISSPKSTKSQTEANHTSDTDSEENERAESGKDWYVLANMSHTSTWDIMLKIRQKLKEYDKALLLYTSMKNQSSPDTSDIKFLRRWFKEEKMGNFPLLGLDSTLWETSHPSQLIALQARKGEDPLGSVFLSKVYLWWHNLIGYRIKDHVDEEAQYFEYSDKKVLRAANVVGSIISSAILVGSVVALAFVDNMFVQLGIVAAFTQMFSLALVLITNARKVEIFAATAAFLAVQVVFVGTTGSSPS